MKKNFLFLSVLLFSINIFAQTITGSLLKPTTNNWSIGGTGTNLEIKDPNNNNLTWATFVDGSRLELTGTPNLSISGYIKGNNPTGAVQINTTYGYVWVGPQSTSYADFNTDRLSYLFNTEIKVNSGFIGSYDEDLVLRASGNNILTLKTTKEAKFEGKVYIKANNRLYFGREETTSGWLSIHNDLSAYNNFIDFNGNIYFRPHSQDGTRINCTMGIQNNGTVTIGIPEKYTNSYTDTEGHLLSVNGGILCKNITIKTDVPQSDFVFENDYKLLNLKELENYILENKHLPKIPSAEEFKENGYKVGEMDNLLLMKVEELTLYIIELQKQLAITNDELAKLKQK